ncbi:unnamed protein product [Mytilus coruscus]|uniref:DNA-directed DNA polymerase n=1 Tax=Mytilus coruscus TaxID=42192 RepID=A0A6J8EZN1_MYTCO|nr:unnamed protein product [Mytilus coruscus]
MIQHAKRAGEKKLFINNKCYKVDGYYYDRENKMRNVYEFLDVIGMDVQNVIVLKKYERVIVGTWSTIEIDKAIEKGYKLQKIYELEHFEKTSTDIFKLYVDTFMKYKQEASGCKCDPKYCKPDCENDKESHARLKLYELLDILQERVLYMDTDSCIYNDDGSEACKKVENMMGSKLGDLTDEIVSKHNANHIKQFISASPKDYSMKLDTEKLVSCCKAYTEKDDPYARVILGKIKLSNYQICCLRDDGECPLTSKQMEVMEKFKGKKLSKFPPGWDAFIRPDKIYEYVFEKPCPEI